MPANNVKFCVESDMQNQYFVVLLKNSLLNYEVGQNSLKLRTVHIIKNNIMIWINLELNIQFFG